MFLNQIKFSTFRYYLRLNLSLLLFAILIITGIFFSFQVALLELELLFKLRNKNFFSFFFFFCRKITEHPSRTDLLSCCQLEIITARPDRIIECCREGINMVINIVQKILQALSNPGFLLVSQSWLQSIDEHFLLYDCPLHHSVLLTKCGEFLYHAHSFPFWVHNLKDYQ